MELGRRGSLRQGGRAADIGEDDADRDLGATGLRAILPKQTLHSAGLLGIGPCQNETRECPTDAMERGRADLAPWRRRDVAPPRTHLEERRIRPGQEPSPQRGRRIFVAHLIAHGRMVVARRRNARRCGRSVLDEHDVKGARAVDALDPLELDVARRGRAADPGLGPGGIEAASASGTVPTTWLGPDDADVEVRQQAEGPAALVRARVEDDRAGLGDRDRAAGDDAVEARRGRRSDSGGSSTTRSTSIAPSQAAGARPARRSEPRAVGREDRRDRRREAVGRRPVDGRPVVARPARRRARRCPCRAAARARSRAGSRPARGPSPSAARIRPRTASRADSAAGVRGLLIGPRPVRRPCAATRPGTTRAPAP